MSPKASYLIRIDGICSSARRRRVALTIAGDPETKKSCSFHGPCLATTSEMLPCSPLKPGSSLHAGTTDSHGYRAASRLSSVRSYRSSRCLAPKNRCTHRVLLYRVSSSTSALIGARPVPPATHTMSRVDLRSSVIEPIGAASRIMSPTLTRRTRALDTHPAPSDRTWNSIRPSLRGALAIEYVRHNRDCDRQSMLEQRPAGSAGV